MDNADGSVAPPVSLQRRFLGIIVSVLIFIAVSSVVISLGTRDELDFPGLIGFNSGQGIKSLGVIALALGLLFAWHTNPVFPDLSFISRVLSKHYSNHHLQTSRVLLAFWVLSGFGMYSIWDPTAEKFSLKKFVSIEQALENGINCYGEGLLGETVYKGGDFYMEGVAIASLERSNDTYSMFIYQSRGKFLLETVQETNGARRIGLKSDYPGIGLIICAR